MWVLDVQRELNTDSRESAWGWGYILALTYSSERQQLNKDWFEVEGPCNIADVGCLDTSGRYRGESQHATVYCHRQWTNTPRCTFIRLTAHAGWYQFGPANTNSWCQLELVIAVDWVLFVAWGWQLSGQSPWYSCGWQLSALSYEIGNEGRGQRVW